MKWKPCVLQRPGLSYYIYKKLCWIAKIYLIERPYYDRDTEPVLKQDKLAIQASPLTNQQSHNEEQGAI